MEEKLVLQIDSIMKTFPGVKVLDGVHLSVRRGEAHAPCGESSASKSTLMKTIARTQGYTSGHMYVSGEEVVFHSIKGAERKGITMIYQEFNMTRDLSVTEDMYLRRLPKTPYGAVGWKKLYKDTQEELDHSGLKFDYHTKVRNLSVTESQMTEVAKCPTIGTKVIIMDEPTVALADEKIRILFKIIAGLKTEDISILYIFHRMDEIFQISGRLTVLKDGKYIATKDIGDTNYDEMISMVVGRSVTNLYPERGYVQDEIVLELKNICGKGVYNVDIRFRKGEILEMVGLLGSSTIELSKIVYGAPPMGSGEIYINGEKKDCSSPKRALEARIGFVPDDRKQEGLVLMRNIRKNVSLSSLDKIAHFVHLDKKLETRQVSVQAKRFNTKISSLQQLTDKLSDDNQQKMVFAKVLEVSPSILILDESTRGVNMDVKAEIYQIMDELTRTGRSIILISTDLPETIGMSDRVVIVGEGHTVLEIPKSEMDQEIILAHAFGGVNENE